MYKKKKERNMAYVFFTQLENMRFSENNQLSSFLLKLSQDHEGKK